MSIEIDPARLCMFLKREQVVAGDGAFKEKLTSCEELADYRVAIYGEQIREDGEWKQKITPEYYCHNHFNQQYRFAPITKVFTFRRIERRKSQESRE